VGTAQTEQESAGEGAGGSMELPAVRARRVTATAFNGECVRDPVASVHSVPHSWMRRRVARQSAHIESSPLTK
jgi:hypothetical protein